VIIDDPVKNREEADSATMREKTFRWYTSTLRTRLEPRGAIVMVLTRWHDDDLAGRLLSQAARDPLADQWTVVSLPAVATEADVLGRQPGQALDPIRFDEAALAATRATIGPRDWSALYQQTPMPDGGSVFQATWFARADGPERGLADQVIQAWDTAFKAGQENDYSACVTLGKFGNEIHVLHVWRGRVGFPELLAQMKRQNETWRPNVIVVEDKGSGTSALQELRSTSLPVVAVQAERDKVARANMITGMCEAGRVHVPSTWWGDDLVDELVRFPAGAHDDQVDALVYGLMRLRSKGVRIGWA
jgi:predicted phage terminase large subunit-like protein